MHAIARDGVLPEVERSHALNEVSLRLQHRVPGARRERLADMGCGPFCVPLLHFNHPDAQSCTSHAGIVPQRRAKPQVGLCVQAMQQVHVSARVACPSTDQSKPEAVWGHYGLTPEQAERGGLNTKMFNSFLDGSKPSIERTAVANATGLHVPSNGLLYPPASVEEIPFVTRPIAEGGVLERKGMVEVISSLEANGRVIPYDIRMGVWVAVEGQTDYVRNCFEEYNAHTDPSGRYFTRYKRWHLIGLEVGYSVASIALRREATGVAHCWNADVVATAKRDLLPGEVLDGERLHRLGQAAAGQTLGRHRRPAAGLGPWRQAAAVCIQPPPEASRIAGHGGAADALAGQPEGTSAGSRLGGGVLSIQAMTAPCR